MAKIDHALVINIKSRHREVTFWLLRFFLETDRLALGIEFNHAVALRVAHLISENARAALDGESIPVEIEFPVKNVIAQDKRRPRVANESRTDQKSLSDSFRLSLLGIFDPNTKLRAAVQIVSKHRQIFRRGNDQDLSQAAEHERGQRVANHWFVVDREKLFTDDLSEREKTCPGATGKKNGLFVHPFIFGLVGGFSRLQRPNNSDHSSQKAAPLVKSIPIFFPSSPIAFREPE